MLRINNIGLSFLLLIVLILLIVCLPFGADEEMAYAVQNGQLSFLIYGGLILIGALGIIYLLGFIQEITLTKIDLLISIGFGYVIAHTLIVWGTQPPIYFWGLVTGGVIYLAIRNCPKGYISYILLAIIIVGAAQAIYGILQLYGIYPSYHRGFKMTGSFFNPGPYAGYLVSVLPIAIGIYLFKDTLFTNLFLKRIYSIITRINIVSILLVLPACQSRAAWLAALTGTIYLLATKYKIKTTIKQYLPTRKLKIIVISGILTIGLAGSIGLYQFKKGSADGRWLIWKVTANMVVDAPFFGHGLEKFKAKYMDYQAAYFKPNPDIEEAMVADNTTYVFNELLHVTAELGMVGLIMVLGILGMLWKLKSTHNQWINIVKSGLYSIFIFSCFSYPFAIWPIVINGVIYVAYLASISSHLHLPRVNFKQLILITGICCLVACYVGINRKIEQNEGYYKWRDANLNYQIGAYESAVVNYEQIFPQLKNNGQFLLNYGKTLEMANKHQKAIEILDLSKNYLANTITYTTIGDSYRGNKQCKLAEQAYLQADAMIPIRFYPKYLLAKLYKQKGEKQKAIRIANQIMEMEVKIPSTAVKEIREEMNRILQSFNMGSS